MLEDTIPAWQVRTPATPTLSTEEVAALGKVRAASIRHALCVRGHWNGLRPVKLPNRRLLWDAAEVARVLGGCDE